MFSARQKVAEKKRKHEEEFSVPQKQLRFKFHQKKTLIFFLSQANGMFRDEQRRRTKSKLYMDSVISFNSFFA